MQPDKWRKRNRIRQPQILAFFLSVCVEGRVTASLGQLVGWQEKENSVLMEWRERTLLEDPGGKTDF